MRPVLPRLLSRRLFLPVLLGRPGALGAPSRLWVRFVLVITLGTLLVLWVLPLPLPTTSVKCGALVCFVNGSRRLVGMLPLRARLGCRLLLLLWGACVIFARRLLAMSVKLCAGVCPSRLIIAHCLRSVVSVSPPVSPLRSTCCGTAPVFLPCGSSPSRVALSWLGSVGLVMVRIRNWFLRLLLSVNKLYYDLQIWRKPQPPAPGEGGGPLCLGAKTTALRGGWWQPAPCHAAASKCAPRTYCNYLSRDSRLEFALSYAKRVPLELSCQPKGDLAVQ